MPLTRRGKWLAAGGGGLATLVVLGLMTPNRPSGNPPTLPPPYEVEASPTGKYLSFGALASSAPGTLTIACKGGKISDFSVKLDQLPASPPPLRGVFADIRFGNEAQQRIEVGYLSDGYWSPRDEEHADANEIARRFARGDRLDFTLPMPDGSGSTVSWQYPAGVNLPDCRI